MNIKVPRAVGGALCAVGAALSILIMFLALMNTITHPGEPAFPRFTKGTVVRYDTPNTDATGRRLASPLHCPIVSYRDLSGAEHSFLSDAGSEQETYAVGDRVTVAYLPHSKGGQEVVSSATCWGARVWLGWALTIVAVVCLIPFVTIAYALLNGRRVRDVVASLKHAQRPSSPPSWSWSRSE